MFGTNSRGVGNVEADKTVALGSGSEMEVMLSISQVLLVLEFLKLQEKLQRQA